MFKSLGDETSRATRRTWFLAGAIVLIAGHGLILAYVSRHLRLSAWLVGGLFMSVVLKHLGLPGVPLAALGAKLHGSRSPPLERGPARPTGRESSDC
jgi:hypothetical protein